MGRRPQRQPNSNDLYWLLLALLTVLLISVNNITIVLYNCDIPDMISYISNLRPKLTKSRYTTTVVIRDH